MTPEEWFESRYVFTGDKTDFVSMKEMYEIYCFATYSDISWNDFKYKVSRVQINNQYVFHPKKGVNGKARYNILWKMKQIH